MLALIHVTIFFVLVLVLVLVVLVVLVADGPALIHLLVVRWICCRRRICLVVHRRRIRLLLWLLSSLLEPQLGYDL